VLLAYNDNNLSLSNFTLAQSIEFLAMLVIGGAGYSLGPLFGVAFVNLLRQYIIPVVILPTVGPSLPNLLPFIDRASINAAVSRCCSKCCWSS
jgi:branched-chain amino acid transport system permease protein